MHGMGRDGRRRYLGFLFRAEGLAVEIEGYAHHGSRDARRRDIPHPTPMPAEIHAALVTSSVPGPPVPVRSGPGRCPGRRT